MEIITFLCPVDAHDKEIILVQKKPRGSSKTQEMLNFEVLYPKDSEQGSKEFLRNVGCIYHYDNAL
jgi:hypothetical protein